MFRLKTTFGAIGDFHSRSRKRFGGLPKVGTAAASSSSAKSSSSASRSSAASTSATSSARGATSSKRHGHAASSPAARARAELGPGSSPAKSPLHRARSRLQMNKFGDVGDSLDEKAEQLHRAGSFRLSDAVRGAVSASARSPRHSRAKHARQRSDWVCRLCKFENPPSKRNCSMCNNPISADGAVRAQSAPSQYYNIVPAVSQERALTCLVMHVRRHNAVTIATQAILKELYTKDGTSPKSGEIGRSVHYVGAMVSRARASAGTLRRRILPRGHMSPTHVCLFVYVRHFARACAVLMQCAGR